MSEQNVLGLSADADLETPGMAAWPVDLTEAERAQARLLPVRSKDRGTVYAIVDADLYPALARWAWRLDKAGYVRRTTSVGPTRINLMLHRVVMCCTAHDGLELDHVNRCVLDNRRCNLRFVTRAQNLANRTHFAPGARAKPRFEKGKWRGQFQHKRPDGVTVVHRVGGYPSYEEAEVALADAARRHEESGCDAAPLPVAALAGHSRVGPWEGDGPDSPPIPVRPVSTTAPADLFAAGALSGRAEAYREGADTRPDSCECGKPVPFDGGKAGVCECCSTCTTTGGTP